MLQLFLLGIVALIAILTGPWHNAISVLLGGSAWIIPNLYFVRKLFKPKTTRDSHALLKDFFLGEGIKLLSSVGLIAIIVCFIPVKTMSFISGYIAAIAASFFMPLLFIKKTQK